MSNEAVVPKLLRVHEVAKAIRVPAWRIYQLHQRGEGPPALRIGKVLYHPEHLLIAWINEKATSRPIPEVPGRTRKVRAAR